MPNGAVNFRRTPVPHRAPQRQSVADRKALSDMCRMLELIDHGHRIILNGYLALAIRSNQELIATQTEEGAHYRALTGEKFRQIRRVIDVAGSCNEPAARCEFFRMTDDSRDRMTPVERFVQNCRTDKACRAQ